MLFWTAGTRPRFGCTVEKPERFFILRTVSIAVRAGKAASCRRSPRNQIQPHPLLIIPGVLPKPIGARTALSARFQINKLPQRFHPFRFARTKLSALLSIWSTRRVSRGRSADFQSAVSQRFQPASHRDRGFAHFPFTKTCDKTFRIPSWFVPRKNLFSSRCECNEPSIFYFHKARALYEYPWPRRARNIPGT